MINNGDVFITKLERGFFGAFRILKVGGHFGFSKDEFFLIAITSYLDIKKPKIDDQRLKETLIENRFSLNNKPNIQIYPGNKIEKQFEYLGNLPLTKEEENLEIKIGGKYPVVVHLPKDFGNDAFREWRWINEKEIYINETEANKMKSIKSLYSKEFEPFGSDEGFDTLNIITNEFKKDSNLNFSMMPKYIIETLWDMKYISVEDLSEEEVLKQLKEDEMNTIQSDRVTYATAFAQLKLTGKVDSTVKEKAMLAIKRLSMTAKVLKWDSNTKIMEKMIHDLSLAKINDE